MCNLIKKMVYKATESYQILPPNRLFWKILCKNEVRRRDRQKRNICSPVGGRMFCFQCEQQSRMYSKWYLLSTLASGWKSCNSLQLPQANILICDLKTVTKWEESNTFGKWFEENFAKNFLELLHLMLQNSKITKTTRRVISNENKGKAFPKFSLSFYNVKAPAPL